VVEYGGDTVESRGSEATRSSRLLER
jgi:hypothetical protein